MKKKKEIKIAVLFEICKYIWFHARMCVPLCYKIVVLFPNAMFQFNHFTVFYRIRYGPKVCIKYVFVTFSSFH